MRLRMSSDRVTGNRDDGFSLLLLVITLFFTLFYSLGRGAGSKYTTNSNTHLITRLEIHQLVSRRQSFNNINDDECVSSYDYNIMKYCNAL